MRNPLIVAWYSYVNLLKRKPLIAHSLSTGVLMTSADALSQKLIEKKKRLDFYRNKNFLLVGSFYLFIFTPPLLFGVLSLLTLLRHRSVDMWKRQISENYSTVLLMNYKVTTSPDRNSRNFRRSGQLLRLLILSSFRYLFECYILTQ
ncbi:hypothetical protein CRM22_005649 [Opisthorchis felineus]|uniref:Uncharacterized protein n=1 Tax=Opisthorchis felineus TaxID=147828 RepID=A0A4S2LX18_OPIFE|nr:hypothetical protein CRM22_005649 [Opisthorchis felineus]